MYYYIYIIIHKIVKITKALASSLRSFSALISEIEGQLTEELVLIHAKMLL